MKQADRQALRDWEEYLLSIIQSTTVDLNESEADKKKRIKELEADFEAWAEYYFPKYAFAKPAPFHKRSSRKFLKSNRIVQRRAWARGLAKSTRRMMEVLYKLYAQKVRGNMLLISKSEANAIRLLAPYQANLEVNQRLINDYGKQEQLGTWKENEFITKSGHSFRAVGADQNPRGSKNEEMRVNIIVFDDVDDDEVCRNEERLDARWQWCQEAVIPTVDISADYWIVFDNNIISEDSIAVRAAQIATDVETVNIRDENGVSTWPQKNTEADIDYMLSIISYESGQKEYFNNPMSAGKTFPEMTWGMCPPLREMEFIIIYADPATSNKDKPSLKSKMSNSRKAAFVIGKKLMKYYVYTGFLDVMNNSHFIDALYACNDYAKPAKQLFCYIENNSLQDPFYEQVLMPLIFAKGKERNQILSVIPDKRDKPDKWFRIEGTLEPINRMGLLVLNIREKENPHMQRLEAQFKAAKPTSRMLDGPDCIEGGVWIINQKQSLLAPIHLGMRRKNSKRY